MELWQRGYGRGRGRARRRGCGLWRHRRRRRRWRRRRHWSSHTKWYKMKEQDAPDAEQRHDIATKFECEVVDEVHHSDGEVVHDG